MLPIAALGCDRDVGQTSFSSLPKDVSEEAAGAKIER